MSLWSDEKNFISILPSNSTLLEREVEKACVKVIFDFNPKFQNLKTPNKMPASLYLQLANELQVDFWDESFSNENKQTIINNAFSIHRNKGTKSSIERALKVAGFKGFRIIERVYEILYNGERLYNGVYYYGGIVDKNTIKYDGKIQYLGSSFYSIPSKWAYYSIEFDGTELLNLKQSIQVKQLLKAVAPARCKLVSLVNNILHNGKIKYDAVYNYGHYK